MPNLECNTKWRGKQHGKSTTSNMDREKSRKGDVTARQAGK